MKMEEAQLIAAEMNKKIADDVELTVEEKIKYQQALDYIDSVNSAAKEFAKTQRPGMTAEERVDAALGKDTTKKFWTPGRRIAAEVVGGIAIAAISVFGGMRLERSRASKRSNSLDNLTSTQLGDGVGQHHVDSPQSHPAQSSDDGRLAQNRNSNQPTGNARQRAGANA